MAESHSPAKATDYALPCVSLHPHEDHVSGCEQLTCKAVMQPCGCRLCFTQHVPKLS